MTQLRHRNGSIPQALDTPDPNVPHADFTLTTSRELNCFNTLRFAFGPAVSVVYVFFPVLLAIQGKFYTAGNGQGIVWRGSEHGGVCGDENALPNVANPLHRSELLASPCLWLPNNPVLLELGVHYAAFVAYVMAVVLFGAGMAIWVLAPVADEGAVRQHMLHIGVLTWPTLFLLMVISGSGDSLWVTASIGIIAGIIFLISLRTALNGHMPSLVDSHPDVVGVELLASPLPHLMRKSSSLCGIDNTHLSNHGKDSSFRRKTHESSDSFASILLTLVTPRASSKPRPAEVPKLDLSPIHNACAHNTGVLAPTPEDGIKTERLLEMEDGDESRRELDSSRRRTSDVVEKILAHAATAEACGRGIGIALQIVVMMCMVKLFPLSSDAFSYLSTVALAAIWTWVFGACGFSGLKPRTARNVVEGLTTVDTFLLGVQRIALNFQTLRDTLPHVFTLQIMQATLDMLARTLQMMGAVLLVVEFGFGPSQVALVVLVYSVASLFTTIVSYIVLWLSPGPGAKLNLLKVLVAAFAACPVWLCFGMHSPVEVIACTVVVSGLLSSFPAVIWSLQADLIPSGHMKMRAMGVSGSTEALLCWVGPLVVGLGVDITGSLRLGLLSLSVVALLSMPQLLRMNLNKAMGQKNEFESSSQSW